MKKYFLILLLPLFTIGCEGEIDVPYVVDEDEIARYLVDSDLGREYFPQNFVMDSTPFLYPQDPNAMYVHLIDSIERTVFTIFSLENNTANFLNEPVQSFGPPFGISRDAETEIRDRVYFNTIRVEGIDTTHYKYAQNILRYAYFMKLGDDGERFKGWILRGMNLNEFDVSRTSTRMNLYHRVVHDDSLFDANISDYDTFTSYFVGQTVDTNQFTGVVSIIVDSVEYETVHEYVAINEGDVTVERVSAGEEIVIDITQGSFNMFFTVGVYDDTGFVQHSFGYDPGSMQTSITIPNDPLGTVGFIYFQQYYRNTGGGGDTSAAPQINFLLNRKWLVPYVIE